MEHGLSCPWDLPGPGIGPMSFALSDRFLTTAPSREVSSAFFLVWVPFAFYLPDLGSFTDPHSCITQNLAGLIPS